MFNRKYVAGKNHEASSNSLTIICLLGQKLYWMITNKVIIYYTIIRELEYIIHVL